MKTSIYQKILEVQKGLGRIKKTGRNQAQGYDYVTEADLLDEITEKMNAAGLVAFASLDSSDTGAFEGVDKYGKPSLTKWARVTLSLKVVDSETGDQIEIKMTGYSEDRGDKAIYKAVTGANKYAYLKFFGVSTGDDPENDQKESTPVKPKTQKAKPETVWTESDDVRAMMDMILELKKTHGLTKEELQEATGMQTLQGASKDQLEKALLQISAYIDQKEVV